MKFSIVSGQMVKIFAAIFVVCVSLTGNLFAQEISQEHIKAAKAAMNATGATTRRDSILPAEANVAKSTLIERQPNSQEEISTIVDEVAIGLAPRRGDLESEIALLYANTFTQEELTAIADFFNGEIGTKLLRQTPILLKKVDEAAGLWRVGLRRDMVEQVREKMIEAGLQ